MSNEQDALQPVQPIFVLDRFPPLLDALVGLLTELSSQQWDAPTVCSPWSVKDLAVHLLGGDIGIVSRGRDAYRLPAADVGDWTALVALINDLNAQWVTAARRMSPRLVCDLLRFMGVQATAYFSSLDPSAAGGPVSWAGPAAAPVWLDIAREYTERWHHQQQIRDAVGRPGLTEPWFVAPVLDTFVRALPHTYRSVEASEGSAITVALVGDAGGEWTIQRMAGTWQLYAGKADDCEAAVSLPQEIAWRLFTKGIGPEQARAALTIDGNRALAEKVLEMVAVIA